MTRSLVYTRGGGRLGNQLLNYVNLASFSFEYDDFDVLDLRFFPYVNKYAGRDMRLTTLNDFSVDGVLGSLIRFSTLGPPVRRLNHFPPVDRGRIQLLHYFADRRDDAQSLIGGEPPYWLAGDHADEFTLSAPENLERLRSRDVTVIAGWGVRAWPLVENHRDEIRREIRPAEEYMSAARSFVDPLKHQFDLLVGILLRQQDYREWNGGEFFFESPQYKRFAEAFAAEQDTDSVGIVVASDEEQPLEVFGNDIYRFATGEAVGPNHYLENFAELSMCDVILTPPSTFSTMAGFVGDVPLVPLYDGVLDDEWRWLTDPLLDSLSDPIMSHAVS